jgi:hypothetical protein
MKITSKRNQRVIRTILTRLNDITDIQCKPADCDNIRLEQIKSMQNMPLVYSDKMFINMVDEVKVTADESLVFKFKNGAEIEELLD